MRLDKFLADSGFGTRSEIKKLIKSGAVTVSNKGGERLKPETKIDENNDCVFVYGEKVVYRKFIYLMLNKPDGYVSATYDYKLPVVLDLVPEEYLHFEPFPVGRLDKTTTGLLIITNDGDFAHKVISPKSNIEKCYYTELDGELTEEKKHRMENGIVLADGTKCRPAKIEQLSKNQVYITISEGKYHQIKRMFGVVDLGVNSLHRVSIGALKIPEGLKRGECVEIGENELNLINC